MPVWIVRAGKDGDRQEFALRESVAVIGHDTTPDLSRYETRDQFNEIYRKINPDAKPNSILSWAAQAYAFAKRIKVGDLVIVPLKGQAVAIGRVVGDYEFRPDNPAGAKHIRRVKWVAQELPRSRFDADLLNSFGSLLTVCQIKRNNAEERINSILFTSSSS